MRHLPRHLHNDSTQFNDAFRDQWEADFDKNFNRAAKFGIAAWLGILVFNLILWGVIIWAIIELVQHFTAK